MRIAEGGASIPGRDPGLGDHVPEVNQQSSRRRDVLASGTAGVVAQVRTHRERVATQSCD